MKRKSLSLFLSAAFLLLCFTASVLPEREVSAQEQDAATVLYGIDSWAEPYLTIPPEYDTGYQISAPDGGAAACICMSGYTVDVSDTGLVTPKYEIWYWYGNIGWHSPIEGKPYDSMTRDVICGKSVVRASFDGKTEDFTFETRDYADDYADGVMDDYIEKNIPGNLPLYDKNDKNNKLDKICAFPAQYSYSPCFRDSAGMIVSGGGDCWASADTVLKMCRKLGIKARPRNGNRDPKAGSSHRNALVIAGPGEYYELETGYKGNAPRYYSIKPRTSLFCYRDLDGGGIEVYQYDGYVGEPGRLDVPGIIDGKAVLSIGEDFVSLNSTVKEVVLPDTIENIGESAFANCGALKDLDLGRVKTIGRAAFASCRRLACVTVPDSAESIGELAFDGCGALASILIPASVESIGRDAVPDTGKTVILCDEGSAAEIYAKENNIPSRRVRLPGDVNLDGKVDIIDARRVLQTCTGSRVLSVHQAADADVNSDEKTNIIDARRILQAASGSRALK